MTNIFPEERTSPRESPSILQSLQASLSSHSRLKQWKRCAVSQSFSAVSSFRRTSPDSTKPPEPDPINSSMSVQTRLMFFLPRKGDIWKNVLFIHLQPNTDRSSKNNKQAAQRIITAVQMTPLMLYERISESTSQIVLNQLIRLNDSLTHKSDWFNSHWFNEITSCFETSSKWTFGSFGWDKDVNAVFRSEWFLQGFHRVWKTDKH